MSEGTSQEMLDLLLELAPRKVSREDIEKGIFEWPPRWRQRLPSPEAYYRGCVARLGKPNTLGWARGRCPFHNDKRKSLAIFLTRDTWACSVCNELGDMVDFHQRRTGLKFQFAVADLLGIRA